MRTKSPGLFAAHEPPDRSEPMRPRKEMRDAPRLLTTAKSLRDFAAMDGDAVYASVSVAVFDLTGEQARYIANTMASLLEMEVRK